MNIVNRYKYMQFLKNLLPAIKGQIVGCSYAEISLLEAKIGFKLPLAYIEFLNIMGKKAGDFLEGDNILFDSLSDIQKTSRSIVSSSQPNILKGYPFFIFEHQGYSTAYFCLDTNNVDPPVHIIIENDPEKEDCYSYPSFSSFIKDELISYLSLSSELKQISFLFH